MPIDYSKYPPNWKTEIVPAVLKRDENKCMCCGLENKQEVYAIKLSVKADDGRYKLRSLWFRNQQDAEREAGNPILVAIVRVVLTVAHLDHDEENHSVSLDRLASLCQLCHLRYDAKEKYRRQVAKWNTNGK